MSRPVKYKEPRTMISLNVFDDDLKYLKSNGVKLTQFFTQAVKSYKDKTWKYDYLEE
jgi:hypothetical protein